MRRVQRRSCRPRRHPRRNSHRSRSRCCLFERRPRLLLLLLQLRRRGRTRVGRRCVTRRCRRRCKVAIRAGTRQYTVVVVVDDFDVLNVEVVDAVVDVAIEAVAVSPQQR